MAIFAPTEPTAAAATRSPVGLTDSELVAEVRRGCDRAFEQLYERYHRRIAAYIYGMVNDYGRAEDIAQDVFMSALRRMRDTDRPITFKPWVYEIAKNACIDQFRRARRAEEVSYDAEEGLGAADYGRLVTTGPAPDVAVDQKMAIDHLRGAFGGLSQTHHEILVMRELEGLSYREIGERLGMSRPSVESTLFRARRRLGEEYEELVSGERCLRVQAIILAAEATVPGARDQRRLAAHLSHCQPCRRHAKVAGLDVGALVAARSGRAKIAALLPLPAFLRRRWFGDDVAPVANHHVSNVAQLSAQLGGTLSDPSLASWARAAAAAATLAVAGVAGGTAVTEHAKEHRADAPKPASRGAKRTASSAAVTPKKKQAATSVVVPPGKSAGRVPAKRGAPANGSKAFAANPALPPVAAPTPPGGNGGPAAPTEKPAAAVTPDPSAIKKVVDPATYQPQPQQPDPTPTTAALEAATGGAKGAGVAAAAPVTGAADAAATTAATVATDLGINKH